MTNIIVQEKEAIITNVAPWEVNEELSRTSSNPMYKGKEGEKFVSIQISPKGDKNPMKVSVPADSDIAKELQYGQFGTLSIIFSS